ncbi:hypothetical protein Tco_0918791 [Tanacetum coccineum]
MARPITCNYISATEKSFTLSDSNGKIIEKKLIKIEGEFLLKIRNNAFHEMDGEDVYKHINSFLKVVEPLKIRGGDEEPWSEKGVQYQLCDHICEPYRFKNGKAKWPTCTSDIDGFCNGGELPGMVRVGTMTYFQDHSWYDELADGKLKDETLALKAKTEESWGDATLGVLKFCKWLKNCFENFHELEYKKVNTQEIAPFTRMENFGQRPYANIKTKWGNNPHLDTNRIFGRNYEASNVSGTQGHNDDKDDPTPELPAYKIRRFDMMNYSFHDGKEYISIKESEHLNHSKPSLDAYRELLRLIEEGWVVTSPIKEAK